MKSGIIFIIALFFSIQPCFAQKNNMFIPLNYKKAYTNKSRTLEGKPGPNYWQNSADYKINAELIPEKYLLKGSEEITYKNNSPAKLTSLVIRLYQDMFRKGVPHDEDIDPADITDGVAIQKLVINGEEIDFNSKGTFKPQRNGTNLKLVLKKFIEPKSECKIEIEWSFTIQQKTHERMGAYTPNSFFIGYWYPQIAVYDDIDGWDEHQYGGRVEFYNDFNNYDVNIKLPYNYIAWATGILQNGKDNFTKELLDKIDEAKKSDRIINIIKKEDIEKNRVLLNAPYHTWHYVAENVPDFAFAAGDKMLWNASTVKLPDGRETFVSAINDSSTHFCDDVAYYARKAIGFYSTKLPGIPFPYPCETIFNFSGPGGMEFPMMANDGISPDINNNVMVTVHEIAHTYMPFYMGINERKYAWMDEGWAVMLTYYSEADILPLLDVRANDIMILSMMLGHDDELPLIVPSFLTAPSARTYTIASYPKPGMAYDFLKDALGDETFTKALHTYMEEWHGKHPTPFDFFNSFSRGAGENLDWFWDPWFFERGYADLAIKNVNFENDQCNVTISREGILPLPVIVKFIFADNTNQIVKNSTSVWKDGNREFVLHYKPAKKIIRIELGGIDIPDVDRSNNNFIVK